tara:strand:- start:944 stop:1228 length:285 start_codon:yes stop_codon:yes gene_type:complete
MNDDKVTMSKYDFWVLRGSHERIAVKSGCVREMVLCAKVRMDHIATGVTNPDRENRLCYEKDNEHMYSALRLLESARDAELSIFKKKKGRDGTL